MTTWLGNDRRADHWARIPAGNVRSVSDSEWDIGEYRRYPENVREIRWGKRLPEFLPAE